MVSKKVVIALVVVAFLLLLFALFVNMISADVKRVAEKNTSLEPTGDVEQGQVSLIINSPANGDN